jgi:chemotaxis protein methyltransferase CheR
MTGKINDDDCIRFMQKRLPELGYRWKGFRKVRKQVCKRIRRRLMELELLDLSSYHQYLETHEAERNVFDSLCNITISRFYRDKHIFDRLQSDILPVLAEKSVTDQQKQVRCWSAGCCSGEEPFTLQILWRLAIMPQLETAIPFLITATDRDASLIERAKKGIYPAGALKDMPPKWKALAFKKRDHMHQIKEIFQKDVQFLEQDIRKDMPEGEFELILCRNLVFTYYEEYLQQDILKRMIKKLIPGGFFIVGIHETIPEGQNILIPFGKCIYIKNPVLAKR